MTGHGKVNALKEKTVGNLKIRIEDIERVSKQIRKDLGLGECDCIKQTTEITRDQLQQLVTESDDKIPQDVHGDSWRFGYRQAVLDVLKIKDSNQSKDIDINCEDCAYWNEPVKKCIVHAEHKVKEGSRGVECSSYLSKENTDWYCDSDSCDNRYPFEKAYYCEKDGCECHSCKGRAFCSKKCHDQTLGLNQSLTQEEEDESMTLPKIP